MLQWTFGYKYLFKSLLSNICGIYLGMAALGHMVIQCLTFWGTHRVFKIKNNLSNVICIRYCTAKAKSLQLCLTLCDPIDSSPPGSPIPGILQARTWSGLPFPFPMHESEKWKWSRSVMSDCRDPMDYSLPGPSIHGIFRARVLECGGICNKLLILNTSLIS